MNKLERLEARNAQLLEALRESNRQLEAANKKARDAEVDFIRRVNKIARLTAYAFRLRRQRERLRRELREAVNPGTVNTC